MRKLHYNTVTDNLKAVLLKLMSAKEFDLFNLVGGTALSLQLGHRESVDIDLFTDAIYGTINFDIIDKWLENNFPYVDTFNSEIVGFGKTYYVGKSKDDIVKLDLFYTDAFIRPTRTIDTIRMADIEEIIAMKIDVISRVGRKKDFWDLHELLEHYTIDQFINFHAKRYPYSHNKNEILANFVNFSEADNDFEPICLRGKYWEFIKLDFIELLNNFV